MAFIPASVMRYVSMKMQKWLVDGFKNVFGKIIIRQWGFKRFYGLLLTFWRVLDCGLTARKSLYFLTVRRKMLEMLSNVTSIFVI